MTEGRRRRSGACTDQQSTRLPLQRIAEKRIWFPNKNAPPVPSPRRRRGASKWTRLPLLIFVQNHSVDHHIVALTDVVHMYRHTNSHAGAYSVLIKFFAGSGHVNDFFPKTI